MFRKLRLGIIGAGWSGQQHARALQEGGGAVGQTRADAEPDRTAKFANIFSPKKLYSSYTELLGHPKVDAVVMEMLDSIYHLSSTGPEVLIA